METSVAAESGMKSPAGAIIRDKQDGDDTEDDEEDQNDNPTIAASVAVLCSASHEFEWLSPSSQRGLSYNPEKPSDSVTFSDLPREQQQPIPSDEQVEPCQVSPARSSHSRHHKPAIHVWPRRSADIMDHMRMSPNPYNELHGCRRHLSPMRSTWCCPSPPPHAACVHHAGSMFSGMELIPCNYECYGNDVPCFPYQNCSCLPPTGLPHSSRHQDSHSWCRNTSPHHEVIRRESSSPCAMHRSCQGLAGTRRSRSNSSRKRDRSPSAMSPRYSPTLNENNARHSGQEQWQIPIPSEEINNLQKVQELESDKQNLILQASVLADQVEAQADKISELERLLDQKKNELIHLEQNLHQEVLACSSAENTKLELMAELSNLRLRLTASERDRKESDDKSRKLENELILVQARSIDNETDHTILRNKLSRNGTHAISNNEGAEIEKLKSALDSVIVSNDEKDQKIEDLRSSLTKYKKLQDIVLISQNKKVGDISTRDHNISDADLSSFNNDFFKRTTSDANVSQTTPVKASVFPISVQFTPPAQSHFSSTLSKLSSPTSTNTTAFHRSNSVENICPSAAVIAPNSQYGTMPRQTSSHVLQQLQVRLRECEADTDTIIRTSTLEKSELQVNDNSLNNDRKKGKSSGGSITKSSGVSFAAQECVTIPSTEKENVDYITLLTPQPYLIKADRDKNKGFLRFFSKWKKSGSQNIDRIEGDFKRGGIRATAGPRLGWTRDMPQEPDIHFGRWNTEMIMDWLHRIGLSTYVSDCKRWMCNGDMLIKASTYDLEKELGIKNHLHRKKLILAIKSMSTGMLNLPISINNLDYHWVVRWLDDVGLPQYKDSFAEARVDGRVLHCLTVDDLLFLKVTSQLHHVSIRRSIQLLREKGFDPHCLIRRSLPDENKTYTPELVALWSNHRVMEWLRTVDLSEYAPNLRGSGVHGALIVYEPKFNTNLFATLLNIPPTKTLLRRHLATHFKHIVGDDLTQLKREKEAETPLSPSVKIKTVRKPQFALKKKRNKTELESEDYICPMVNVPIISEIPKLPEGEKLIVRRNSDPSPQDQKHLDLKEDAIDRIGAVSKEIATLSTILQDENLNEAPTTIV